MPASLARRTMGLTHRLFGIRSCNEVITGNRDRPCLEYDIKRCIAPCVAAICSQEQYTEAVERTQLFFAGKNDELIDRLRQSMEEASSNERFEEAAHLRDADAHGRDAPRPPAKDCHGAPWRSRRVRSAHGSCGAVVHVFVMRDGRRARARGAGRQRGHFRDRPRRSCRPRWSSFYESRPATGRSAPVE
jgi:excinuclease ABC subunit C